MAPRLRLSEPELVEWGVRIGRAVRPPVVIGLSGPLGAGKSVLARAIGQGAGVVGAMPSPTYTLLHRHETDSEREVVHLDLYRITSPEQLRELGWSQLGDGHEVVLVEWPERAGELMPPDHWSVTLSVPADDSTVRDVEVAPVGHPPEIPPFNERPTP